ncbi:MAG: class I SAM-dependent methyltransferase, partial [Proteobacteria bacterium]
MPELTRDMLNGLPQNGPTDPIAYYRRPVVGWLYRERINMGLRLLGWERFESALEVGYGAGAVLIALAPLVKQLHGIDLDAEPEPVHDLLAERGIQTNLQKGSVYELPMSDETFDLACSFSVFEHLSDYPKALREVHRVLKPHGKFLLGMPAVNRAMEWGFRAIGFKGIEDHHITTPADVAKEFYDYYR